MRGFLFVLLLALVGAGAYGYYNNPAVCRKLGTETVADLKVIFTPGSGKNPAAIPASDSSSASPDSAATPATATATADTQPKHWQQGFVTEPAPVAPTPEPAPAPAEQAAPATVADTPQIYKDSDFTDLSEALAAARTRHRPVIILFTGSDWCPYCQMLDREVISTGEFEKYKDSHFVFVTVDDLHNTTVLDEEKARISGLEQKYQINEFPTLVVVDNDGKELGRLSGYAPGSGLAGVEDGLKKYLGP